MGLLQKAASARMLAGFTLILLIGCNQSSKDQFESYDQLKKSAGQTSHDSAAPKSPAASDPEIAAKSSKTPRADLATTDTPKSDRTQTEASASKLPQSAKSDEKQAAAPTANSKNAPNSKTAAAQSQVAPASATATDAKSAPAYHASIPAPVPGGVPARPVASKAGAGDAAARKPQVLIASRDFKTEGREKALRVSYDDLDLLKVLNMDPVTPDAASKMPAWLKNLDGRRIRIRGFMYPTFRQTDVHAFGLARDNQICCFGRNPKIYDVFDVVLRNGVTTDYIPNRPFDVVGVFHIRPESDEGKLFRLYEMDDATVVAK